jgi:Domain of unknown function (DUF5979)
MISRHRRVATRACLIAAVGLIAATLFWANPASGGQPQATGTLEVVKVVVGDAPDGSFEITIECDTDGTIPLTFDGAGTQSLQLAADTQDCDVDETDDLGALSVTYDCEDVVEPSDPNDQGCQPPGPGGTFFQIQDSEQVVRMTVTNTFADAPVDSSSSTTTAAPAAAAAGVNPTFTG